MKAIDFIKLVAKKSLTGNRGSGIRSIPSAIEAEAKAGEIAAILQSGGIPLQQLDDYIRSEADVLKFLNIIENANKPRVISGTSAEGKAITEKLFGKKGEVVDFPQKRSFKEEIDAMRKSGDIVDEKDMVISDKITDREMFKNSNLNKEPISEKFIDYTIQDINKKEPLEGMKIANKIIKREGEFKDLTEAQSKRILKETEDHIFERDVVPDEFDPEYAKGGRAGFYTGGITDVEPNLSDIGHGSDSLMARTRLMSPGSQATTSTGLNYLLAEDNDNIRVPFKEKGKVSLLDLIKVNASGSKSGRQQIQGAPKGITADNETINAIINLDIPINEKINILGSYAYGKGRNKIEDKGQEIFLDEGGYKSRNIGLGFNQDGEGLSGSVIRNLETGDDDVQIKFLKRFAEGGRIGFKSGKLALADAARRKFMKAAGTGAAGLAALKTGLLGFGKEAAPVVEKVAETAVDFTKGVPPYFFRLVEKIKFMGDSTLATKDKANAYKFKDYVMEEDFAGNIEIIKKGEDLGGNKLEDVYMSYKIDEVPVKGKKGSSKVEEYEEFTARPDAEGKMKDIEPGVPDEVVQEGTIFEDNLSEFGKADGGIARMIGE